MTKKRYSFAYILLAALLVHSHPVWGYQVVTDFVQITGDMPYLRLWDTSAGEPWWAINVDISVDQAFTITNSGESSNPDNVPFIIEDQAPSNSIRIKPDGKVGLGTSAPTGAIEVARTGENVLFVVNRTDGARCGFFAKANQFFIGTSTNHPVLIAAGNNWVTRFNTNGTLNMSDGGSYDGSWNPASSREYKENIKSLTAGEALEAFNGLNPVKFNYKVHKEEERLGFIAEDVPDLVAMNEKKTINSMDIVAVLTKVMQEQQKMVQEQQKAIAELSEEVTSLKKEIRLRGSVASANVE